jgi:hypothetical protein
MAKIKRSLVKSYLNTNTVLSPTWSLISAGVPTGTINMNPVVSTETYIGDDNATITIDSYNPTIPIDATAVNGDAVFDWIDAARKGRNVLEDAETELVNVWAYETAALTYYDAEKVNVSVQCDSFGGEGGKAARIGYTINYIGDPTQGTFSPTALAFVADPINTILTTMIIGSVTLTPLFATDKSWLWYAGSVATEVDAVSMTSTLVGATIVQYDEAAEVAQGADASLAVGVNHLSISVTVGTETSIYYIDITRAAA